MANVTLTSNIVLRHDTTANWELNKSKVLLNGEIGIENLVNGKSKIKIGDGVTTWENLNYFGGGADPIISTIAPTPADSGYDVGTIWIYTDSATNRSYAYLLYNNTTSAAIWKQIVTPDDLSDLGAGDMLKSQFANNPKVAQGYVNAAITADKLTTSHTFNVSGDLIGTAQTFNGEQDINIPVTLDSNVIANKITGAASTVITNNLDANFAVISNADGKISTSPVTAVEIGYLSGVTGGIQAQLDEMSKYIWQDATAITIADGATQEQINIAAITQISTIIANPAKYYTITVQITFTPSDTIKDGVYTYNGTEWVFLYYSTTGINRANGTTAGIVENSDDITFNDGVGTVLQSNKVKKPLSFGSKTYDGSSEQTVLLSDLDGITKEQGDVTYLQLIGGTLTGNLKTPSITTSSISSLDSSGVAQSLSITASDLNMNSVKIINLAPPTLNTDAVTKKYVDDLIVNIPTYTLPVATASLLGGVKSSSVNNQVSVDTTGIMTVNKITTNNLVDGSLFLLSTDTFIIDGGGA